MNADKKKISKRKAIPSTQETLSEQSASVMKNYGINIGGDAKIKDSILVGGNFSNTETYRLSIR
ncbi:MAG: hypothetical protein AB1894_03780 [Chloroflexota bacterium]